MAAHEIFLVNFRNERDLYPPFGIMYVADALEKAGFGTELFHETGRFVEALVERVRVERPLFVGFSTITGPQLLPTVEASRRIHALGVPVVWGGVHATIMPEAVLREGYVDYVVVNEGEESVQELARHLAGDGAAGGRLRILDRQMLGVASLGPDGQLRFAGERPFIEDLDRFAPRWDKIDVERYLIANGPYTRALPVYISRGCPFRCGFCYNEVVMKRTWRQHSDDFVVAQVRWLRERYGIEAVDYADDYLFGRPGPMKRLVEKVGMPWGGQVRVQLLKPEFVAWMQRTRCVWVNIGAESGSQRVLDAMHKDQKVEQIEAGVRNLAQIAPEVEPNLSFIIGLPGERREEVRATLDLIERLCDVSEKVRCAVTVYMPYPGTPLWENALAAGYVAPSRQEGWAELNLDKANTPWLDDEETRALCDINQILFVGRSRGHWLLKPYYALLRERWRRGYFRHYVEGRAKATVLASPLRPALEWAITRLVRHNAVTHKGPVAAPSR
ncbi:MAG: B12-binding domain-containing radical SAM protein [Deltaproteobacteria bacterium]|nr:B12-binding domain-containing radical SAM protein [Deltaproteobacteria bacterium]